LTVSPRGEPRCTGTAWPCSLGWGGGSRQERRGRGCRRVRRVHRVRRYHWSATREKGRKMHRRDMVRVNFSKAGRGGNVVAGGSGAIFPALTTPISPHSTLIRPHRFITANPLVRGMSRINLGNGPRGSAKRCNSDTSMTRSPVRGIRAQATGGGQTQRPR